jgi:SAM-dependent methyltransferase
MSDRPLDISQPAFWEEIYQHGRAGWDLGGPTPALSRLLASGELAPGRLIVLGAGRGHDAREFARRGFTVTAVDFAAHAVIGMRHLADPQAPIEIVQADIFTLPDKLNQTFDMVLEYTCYCAINPARRGEYADLVARLIKPGGTYVALLFPLDQHQGGPPFAVSVDDALSLFAARRFQLRRRETPPDSVPQRRGLEELLIFSAPGAQPT